MPVALVMMALGSFRFGSSNEAYQNFARTAGYRWGKVERIGAAPALQYAGLDTQEVTIEGVIYPHFRGGLRQLDLMRAVAGAGVPMMMVDGLGWVWNRWCIVSIEERKSYFLKDGAPRKIEFTITLQSYGGGFP
ncbi:phage tail protein [Pseudaestuariivita sp.]|uniref:phage tail protein n=1 Tax=Pseudaestuariivita sp. TaxID=2211669 RepID=UPI004059A5C8